MPLTPEGARKEKILDESANQCVETMCEIFGKVTCEVMFLAVARWFGMVLFNLCPTPADRREASKRFADQIEDVITKYERGGKDENLQNKGN